MTLEATTVPDHALAPARPGLPVDARGELPDAATLSCRLHAALERAAGAGLDVELHVSPGAEPLPAPLVKVVECARESAAAHGLALRVIA